LLPGRLRVGHRVVEGSRISVESGAGTAELTGGLTDLGRRGVDVHEGLDVRDARGGVGDHRASAGVSDAVERHAGLRLSIDRLRRYPDYRGQEYVDLGAEIAVDGHLDPRIIGDAARTGRYDPQALKRVWHCPARFGSPFDARQAKARCSVVSLENALSTADEMTEQSLGSVVSDRG
jgi:hypothetical protein